MPTNRSNKDTGHNQPSVADEWENLRAQDLKFTPAELDKAFGKKLNRVQFLKSLLNKQYGKVGDDNG